MALRRQQPPPEPCGCEQRITELEAAVAALARTAVRVGHATDVCALPGNRTLDNRLDAAIIRTAAQGQP